MVVRGEFFFLGYKQPQRMKLNYFKKDQPCLEII